MLNAFLMNPYLWSFQSSHVNFFFFKVELETPRENRSEWDPGLGCCPSVMQRDLTLGEDFFLPKTWCLITAATNLIAANTKCLIEKKQLRREEHCLF